jgi:hypothetical protein
MEKNKAERAQKEAELSAQQEEEARINKNWKPCRRVTRKQKKR